MRPCRPSAESIRNMGTFSIPIPQWLGPSMKSMLLPAVQAAQLSWSPQLAPSNSTAALLSLSLGKKGSRARDEFELVDLLARHTGWPVPVPLRDLKGKSVRHKTVCSPGDMGKTVLSLLDQQAK